MSWHYVMNESTLSTPHVLEAFVAYDYDTQLIESVLVRRNRLTSALIFGRNPFQRRWMDTTRMFLFSVAVAALIAAICVGYSFVTDLLADQRAEQQSRQATSIVLHDLSTAGA
ncbi:hypothetical protein ACX80B_09435 [Arthrobacter monumenti]